MKASEFPLWGKILAHRGPLNGVAKAVVDYKWRVTLSVEDYEDLRKAAVRANEE